MPTQATTATPHFHTIHDYDPWDESFAWPMPTTPPAREPESTLENGDQATEETDEDTTEEPENEDKDTQEPYDEQNGDYSPGDYDTHNGYTSTTEPWLTAREMPSRQEGLNIIGVVPLVYPTFGDSYSDINTRIEEVVTSLITNARQRRAMSVTFSYEAHETEDIVSIVIHASISSVISRTLVRSINFCPHTGEFITITEATDDNTLSLARRILTDRMRRFPEYYYSVPSVQLMEQPFFVTPQGLTILFDEFQLSAIREGYVSLELSNHNMRSAAISMGQVYRPEDNSYNLIMVPLRTVSEQLGFVVHWNVFQQRAEVWPSPIGNTTQPLFWMVPGINAYHTPTGQRLLEAAPYQAANHSIYVPITFFEQIMQLSVYNIDAYDNITFLAYIEQ